VVGDQSRGAMTRSPLRFSSSLFLLQRILAASCCFISPSQSLPICRMKVAPFGKHDLKISLEQEANPLQAPPEVWTRGAVKRHSDSVLVSSNMLVSDVHESRTCFFPLPIVEGYSI